MLEHARAAIERVVKDLKPIQFEEYLETNWKDFDGLLETWWAAYKKWEAADTFEAAYQDDRMTVRTFPANFANEVNKTFKPLNLPVSKMLPDRSYTDRMSRDQRLLANDNLRADAEKTSYSANRGIDSSAFANPDNFASHAVKYEAGLHDLSASLVNHSNSIFDQVHNSGDGVFFSFLPLSQMADQVLLLNLIRGAKAMKPQCPAFYERVRSYRARMTRVKLAAEFDMGTGFTAVEARTEDGIGPQFKLRYGLGSTTTVLGNDKLKVTPEVHEARRQSAIDFKSILNIREGKNELIVAIRAHAGQFPVFAESEGKTLHIITITGKTKARTGKKISAMGGLQ